MAKKRWVLVKAKACGDAGDCVSLAGAVFELNELFVEELRIKDATCNELRIDNESLSEVRWMDYGFTWVNDDFFGDCLAALEDMDDESYVGWEDWQTNYDSGAIIPVPAGIDPLTEEYAVRHMEIPEVRALVGGPTPQQVQFDFSFVGVLGGYTDIPCESDLFTVKDLEEALAEFSA